MITWKIEDGRFMGSWFIETKYSRTVIDCYEHKNVPSYTWCIAYFDKTFPFHWSDNVTFGTCSDVNTFLKRRAQLHAQIDSST